MIMFFLILATVLVTIVTLGYHFRTKIRKKLYQMSMKMQLGSLRTAIHDADKNKEESQRKNIVVFNSSSKNFEPVQKRLLKFVAKSGKGNSNAKQTKYRKRYTPGKKRKNETITADRIKVIEKQSLYVTK